MRSLAVFVPLALATFFSACTPPAAPGHQPAGAMSASPPVAHPAPVVLSIVGTSDLHGYIRRAVVLSGFVDNLRAARKQDGGVVLVDAGDMFQGTIVANQTEGAAVIRAYDAMGYVSATIGNHEFDYGPVGPAAIPAGPNDNPRGALLAAARQAQFPFLAANFLDKATGQPIHWPGVFPSALVDIAGVKVGIVGVSTRETLETTIAANVDDLRMAPLAETINDQSHLLRNRGAQVVIAAAHAGGSCKRFDAPDDLSSCEPQSEIFQVARAVDPALVNLIVGAHTHQAIAHRVHGIPIIQSYAYGRAFGRVDMSVDRSSGEVTVLRIHPPHPTCQEKEKKAPTCTPGAYEGAPVVPNERVRDAVANDLAKAQATRERPVGVTLTTALTNQGHPSSPLGDILAAWMLEARPSADVAIINGGGIRASLPQGPLSYGSFYEMFPFDNRFAAAQVKVSSLRQLIRNGLENGSSFSVAGVEVRASCKNGALQVDLSRAGRVLRDEQTIKILMSDYLATTSRVAEAGMPKAAFTFEADPTIREALVGHLGKKKRTISPLATSPISTPPRWPVSCSK